MDGNSGRYFEWLCGFVYTTDPPRWRLLRYLYEREFLACLEMDKNRAEDGLDLRIRFQSDTGYLYDGDKDRPCSILEMMVALSIRCEEHIMDDPSIGNRTSLWFRCMIENLGLITEYDSAFDREYVDAVIDRFLERRYRSNGEGGLFTVENSGYDLRKVDIWYQAMWYLAGLM